MGPADELHPHSSRLRAQDARKDSVHHLTPLIPMAVAGEGSEMLGPHSLSRQRSQHPLQTRLNLLGASGGQGLLLSGNGGHECPCGSTPFTTRHDATPESRSAACPLGHGLQRQLL